jgi:hypothetical protein
MPALPPVGGAAVLFSMFFLGSSTWQVAACGRAAGRFDGAPAA